MDSRYYIRMAKADDWQDAMAVAWRTFLEFEADVYPEEGVKNFYDFVTDEKLHQMFVMGTYQLMCAFDRESRVDGHDRMVGIISLRNAHHISLLFVLKEYHRQGIGSALIDEMRNYLLTELGGDRMTVNAAPYGVDFYHRLGFRDLAEEQFQDGIVFTPMELYL